MKQLESLLYIAILGLVGLSGIYLQNSMIEDEPVVDDYNSRHDPDYYIENFTAVGMDINGERQYVLEAERMVHFPDDDTSLLDKPHVIQYETGRAPTHIYSETGWVSANGDEVILTGNVRVIRGRDSTGSGGVTTTEKLKVVLKEPIS